MPIQKNYVEEIVKMIWSTTFSMEANPSAQKIELNDPGLDRVSIQITGKWNGVIVMFLSPKLLEKMTPVFFPSDSNEHSKEELGETLCELGNMVGGNIKNLMPSPSTLAIPVTAFSDETLDFPHTKKILQMNFECQGLGFGVCLLESEPSPA